MYIAASIRLQRDYTLHQNHVLWLSQRTAEQCMRCQQRCEPGEGNYNN